MKFSLIICFLLIFSSQNYGCIYSSWNRKDPWFEKLPETLPPFWDKKWKIIKDNYWVNIDKEKINGAIHLLRSKKWIKLNERQMKYFVNEYNQIYGFNPYMVRTVYLNERTDKFKITIYERYVHIRNNSLGRGPMRMKRGVIILFLPDEPKDVYSNCSTAE